MHDKILERRFWLLFLSLVISSNFVFGLENKKSESSRFSLEFSGGYYRIPGQLFEIDGSIVNHPKAFLGSMKSIRGGLDIDENWSVGIQFFKIQASGSGPWERSDTAARLAENGVSGAVTGNTDWDFQGIIFDAERRFLTGSIVPYLRFGAGLGEIDVKFKGQFVGHETLSGFDLPVIENVEDRVKITVPVPALEFGIRFHLTERLNLSLGGFWNTGYGAKTGLGFKF